jgi:ketosteroid isomerase-like protein
MTIRPYRRTAALLLAALALSAGPLAAQGGTAGSASDSSDVAAVVRRFDALMAAGDSTGLLALLADDAVILESGGLETRAEFRSHHLPADIAFARAVTGQQGPIIVRVQGDVAWASSTTAVEGELRGRVINSVSAELMVFSRESGGWKIRAIHWSSRTRRPPGGP